VLSKRKVETHGTARQATDDNITWRLHFACLITKATDTHTEYVILAAFHGNMVSRTCLNVTFIRTLPVLYSKWRVFTARYGLGL